MLRIAIYPSNHGFGHASRMSALAEELNKLNVFTYIRTNRPAFLFSSLIPGRYHVSETSTDFGVLHGAELSVDLHQTKHKLLDLMNSRREIVDREVHFLLEHNVDCVISDIPFLVIEAASYAGIPAIAISNFDWAYIYRALFSADMDLVPVINCIEGIYRKADSAIRLPFSNSQSMGSFDKSVKVGLLARKKEHYLDVRNKHGISIASKMILSIESGIDSIDLQTKALAEGFNGVFITNRSDIVGDNVIAIDPQTDLIDYVYAADAIVTKPGYSIFAEGMQFGRPFAVRRRDKYPEDGILFDHLEKHVPVWTINPDDLCGIDSLFDGRTPGSRKASATKNCNYDIAQIVYSMAITFRYKGGKLVSVFDLGSNNLNYSVYDSSKRRLVHRHQFETGLGKGFRDNKLHKDGVMRLKKALNAMIGIDKNIPSTKEFIGTEAVRRAKNNQVIKSFVGKQGFKLSIITPREEARLVFETVRDEVDPTQKTLLIDIGGRSCEFVSVYQDKIISWLSFSKGLQSFIEEKHSTLYSMLREKLEKQFSETCFDRLVLIGLTSEIIGGKGGLSSDYDQKWGRVGRKSLERIQSNIDCQNEPSQKLVFCAIQLIVLVMDRYGIDDVWLCYHGISVGFAKQYIRNKGINEVLH